MELLIKRTDQLSTFVRVSNDIERDAYTFVRDVQNKREQSSDLTDIVTSYYVHLCCQKVNLWNLIILL